MILPGVEGDVSWMSLGGEFRSSTSNFGGLLTTSEGVSAKLDWLATARGRLGWAFDRILVYGTGGVAFGGVDASVRRTSAGRQARARNVWNGRWWLRVRFCLRHCEALYERYDGNADFGAPSWLASIRRADCFTLGTMSSYKPNKILIFFENRRSRPSPTVPRGNRDVTRSPSE